MLKQLSDTELLVRRAEVLDECQARSTQVRLLVGKQARLRVHLSTFGRAVARRFGFADLEPWATELYTSNIFKAAFEEYPSIVKAPDQVEIVTVDVPLGKLPIISQVRLEIELVDGEMLTGYDDPLPPNFYKILDQVASKHDVETGKGKKRKASKPADSEKRPKKARLE